MSNRKKKSNNQKWMIILIATILVCATLIAAILVKAMDAGKPSSSNPPYSSLPQSSAEISSNVSSEISSVPTTSIVTSIQPISSTVASSNTSLPRPTDTTSAAPVADKVCYLTFDDGPSSNTLKILDILDRYDAKATFFVVGSALNSASGKDIVKKAYSKGHAIGLHANEHTYSKIYANKTAFYNDLAAISDKVYNIIGVRPAITRFPGGSSNTASRSHDKGIKIMSQLTKELPQKGYQYYDWNIDSTDASGNNISADKIYNSVVTQTWDGTRKELCVLMHDTEAKDTTVEALPRMIEELARQGYEFRALDPSVGGFHHGVNN